MTGLGLPIKQVLQNGPRYAVVSTEWEGTYALFKMVIPGAANPLEEGLPNPESLIPLELVIQKEIMLLQFLEQMQPRFMGYATPVYEANMERGNTWYVRELIRGKPISPAHSPFRFTDRFYDEVSPEMIFDYFSSLHRLSDAVPTDLADLFQTPWPYEYHVAKLIDALTGDFNHPWVVEHHEAIGTFLAETQTAINPHRDVITHHEPYGSHIFLKDNRIGMIDWERASLGHRLHDFSIIWLRTFDNPDWQKRLMEVLAQNQYFTSEEKPMWDMQLLAQAIANLNHFRFNPHDDKHYQNSLDTFLLNLIKSITLQYS